VLIAAATSFVGLRQDHGAPDRLVERFLTEVAGPTDGRWSIAFVQHAGFWSHFEYSHMRSAWPLPLTGSADRLAAFAMERRVLSSDEPARGEIFLLWSPARRVFVRGGIVLDVVGRGAYPSGKGYRDCVTIEGDTDELGMARGRGVFHVRRKLSMDAGDRMVRWTDLDERSAATGITGCWARQEAA
jgi:hypothetical protein